MTFLVKLFAISWVYFIVRALIHSSAIASALASGPSEYARLSIRHIERGGIGYSQGYTTFEVFCASDPQKTSLIPLLDMRCHVFDDGELAANMGLGFRKLLGNRVCGVNAYYDYRDTNEFHYNQLGLGFEALGKIWDFRINGYLPLRNSVMLFGPELIESGNNLFLVQKYQFAMKGANAELGFHIGNDRLLDFYTAVGPYYYIGEIGPAWGGKIRLACQFKKRLIFELRDSYDRIFHNNFQCQFTFTLPLGRSSCMKENNGCICYERMIQSVGREEIIVVGGGTQSTPLVID